MRTGPIYLEVDERVSALEQAPCLRRTLSQERIFLGEINLVGGAKSGLAIARALSLLRPAHTKRAQLRPGSPSTYKEFTSYRIDLMTLCIRRRLIRRHRDQNGRYKIGKLHVSLALSVVGIVCGISIEVFLLDNI